MPVTGKYGNPAPAGPPMVVQERAPQPAPMPLADVSYIPVRATATTLREQMQARAAELEADIAALSAKQDELSLLRKMLEVK